jgi:hypothetical protein
VILSFEQKEKFSNIMERVKQKLAMPEKEFEKVCVMCQYTSARPMNILGAFYPTLS